MNVAAAPVLTGEPVIWAPVARFKKYTLPVWPLVPLSESGPEPTAKIQVVPST